MTEKKKTGAKKVKKGGNVVQDLQTLAVPFGILLAKKGLDSVVAKDAKEAKQKKKTTAKGGADVGGKPKAPKKAKRGGTTEGGKNLAHEFNELSSQIEKFLKKY